MYGILWEANSFSLISNLLSLSFLTIMMFLASVEKPSKSFTGYWLMVNNGSSCGKPNTGEANLLRILSPTSPFQSWSSIITAIVLIAAEESSGNLFFLNEQELAIHATKKP